MIQEDYASFELTRVLKQKGYPFVKVVKDNGDKPLFYDSRRTIRFGTIAMPGISLRFTKCRSGWIRNTEYLYR